MGPAARGALALTAGVLLSAGLPPFGWWALALAGAGLLATVVHGSSLRARIGVGVAAGLGFLGPGLWWMTEFHLVGFALAVALETALFALGIVAVPSRRGILLGFPAALVLIEAVRGAWPFGGVPVAILAQTQIGGPLAPPARLGGSLLVAGLVGLSGVVLAAVARRAWRPAAAAAVVVALAVAGAVAPPGRAVGTLDVAVVQIGGQRGLRAVDNRAGPGFATLLATAGDLPDGLDLVLFPEGGVGVEGDVRGTARGAEVAALARHLGTTVVSGVTQREDHRFRNLAVAWGPDGDVVGRYEKNQRVPFGEYVPWRSLLDDVVDLRAVPRDALAGEGPGLLTTPAGDLGVVISYEVFFPRRARAAVHEGAEVLLVPTNASSYPTTQMPALELGAARLRAIETGRAVVQAAPTGFSAIVAPDGTVRQQSDLGQPAVLGGEIQRRTGLTLAMRLGDLPLLVLAAAALAAAWWRAGLRRRSRG